MSKAKNPAGVILEIYRSTFKDDLAKFKDVQTVTAIHPDLSPTFEPDERAPAVKFVTRNRFGKDYTHAEPLEPGSYAFSGSFVFGTGNGFRDLFPNPIPLHDRQMDLEKRM